MSNLKKRLNEIMSDLEKNIKNQEDLEYVKSQVYNISLLFLDEIDKIAELNLGRINLLIDREKELSKKIATMEKVINNIEKEMYISPDCDFEIVCPYCNAEFVEEFPDGMEKEVKCPECGNTIELDWLEDECACCDHDDCDCCYDGEDAEEEEDSEEQEESNEENDETNNEDDM